MGENTHDEINKWQERYNMTQVRLIFWFVGMACILWWLFLDIKYSYVPALAVMDWQLAAVCAIITTPLEMGYMWLLDRKKEWARTDRITKAFLKYVVTVLLIWDVGTNMFGVGMGAIERGNEIAWAILIGVGLGFVMAFAEIPFFLLAKQIFRTLAEQRDARQQLIRLGVIKEDEEGIFGGGWND